ncbi:MAG TPA: MFS transporter [Vicinamibacterales bacterium]|nr:MFS transporter [Vicinamibacterales bacterium]
MPPTSAGVPASAIRVAHAAFVLTGVVTTLLGPLLPVLVARWSLDDAQAGTFFTAQFAGSICGVGVSGLLVERVGYQRALASGLALMASGVGALGMAGWPAALVAVGCYGVGLGITIPATNLFVAAAHTHDRSAALNILNFAWAAGAVAAPPVLAWLAARGRADLFVIGLASALAAAVLGVLAFASARHARLRVSDASTKHARLRISDASTRQIPRVQWRSPAFVVFGALFFVYVGTENAVAGWAAVHVSRIAAAAAATSAPAFFWGALLAGRAAAPAMLRRVDEERLMQAALALATAGLVLLIAARSLAAALAGTSMCGLGLSIVFPTTMAQLSRTFGDASGRAAAAAFVLAGLGGATVPWLVGRWSASAGSLRTGLLVPLFGCAAMMALHAWRRRISA